MPYDIQQGPGFLGTLLGLGGAAYRVSEQQRQDKAQREAEAARAQEAAATAAREQTRLNIEQREEPYKVQGLQLANQQQIYNMTPLPPVPSKLATPPKYGTPVAQQIQYYQSLLAWAEGKPGKQAEDYRNDLRAQLRDLTQRADVQAQIAGRKDVAVYVQRAMTDRAALAAKNHLDVQALRNAGSAANAATRLYGTLHGGAHIPYTPAEIKAMGEATTAMANAKDAAGVDAAMNKYANDPRLSKAAQQDIITGGRAIILQKTSPKTKEEYGSDDDT